MTKKCTLFKPLREHKVQEFELIRYKPYNKLISMVSISASLIATPKAMIRAKPFKVLLEEP